VSVFVDTSAFYASIDASDSAHVRARGLLDRDEGLITSDHVVVECWLLLNGRAGYAVAERFLGALRGGAAVVEPVLGADLEAASRIAVAFPDQTFSIVDRTSFALMERLGVTRAASFDDDFAIYRYGPRSDRAFELLR
jgi:predicted nucleic acid-binding protein